MDCSPFRDPSVTPVPSCSLDSYVFNLFISVLPYLGWYFHKPFWLRFARAFSFTDTCIYLINTLKWALSLVWGLTDKRRQLKMTGN